MRGLARGLAGVVGLLTGVGCVSSGRLEEQMSRLRRDMTAVRKQLADTELKLERLEGRLTLLALGQPPVESPKTPPVSAIEPAEAPVAPSRQPPPSLPLVRLGNNAQAQPPAGQEPWMDPGALDDGSPPILIKLGPDPGAGGERIAVDRKVLRKHDPVLSKPKASNAEQSAGDGTVEGAYRAALSTLREDGKAKKALKMFRRFRADHGSSKYADNAAYWIAECLRSLNQHKRALGAYRALLREFPRSAKRPDTLVGMAEAQLALNRVEAGRATLKKVIEEYPGTEASSRAEARLASFGAEEGR